MQYPIPHSNSTQTIESLEQPTSESLQKAKHSAISSAEFKALAENSFLLQPYHRHTN